MATKRATDEQEVDERDVDVQEVDERDVDVQAATTWYAPNQQCVHADQSGPACVHATGVTAGTPGVWAPAGSDRPNTVADLIAGVPLPITPTPATNWTVGQYVVTETAGSAGEANWNGTAWVAGRHA